ncbi:MAG TPA: hypothetical protein VIG06_08875 [Kofleriaceae bacterium]
MYSSRPVPLLTALTSLLLASSAGVAAADQSLQAITTVSTGYTDNVQLVPEEGDPETTPQVSKDAFANIAPGMIFAHQAPRIAQVLRYTINVRLYAEASSANSYSNALQYNAIIPLSPLSELSLDASASHGRLNAFDTAPAETTIDTRARGDVAYARAAAGAAVSRTLTRSWRVVESAGAAVFQPTDDTTEVRTRWTLDDTLALSKSFNFDALTANGRITYSSLDRGEGMPNEETIMLGPELRWVHDLSQDFSTDASVGATITYPLGEFENRLVLPVGSAYLRYSHNRYSAAAGYRRMVATNLLVGETEATHIGEVRGTVPIPKRDDLSVSGAVGYANGRSVDTEAGQLVGHTVRWIGDVSTTWKATDEVNLALRYSLVFQDREQPLEEIMEEHTRRNMVMVVLEGRYPSRQAVELEQRNDGRADGGEEEVEAKRESGQVR